MRKITWCFCFCFDHIKCRRNHNTSTGTKHTRTHTWTQTTSRVLFLCHFKIIILVAIIQVVKIISLGLNSNKNLHLLSAKKTQVSDIYCSGKSAQCIHTNIAFLWRDVRRLKKSERFNDDTIGEILHARWKFKKRFTKNRDTDHLFGYVVCARAVWAL